MPPRGSEFLARKGGPAPLSPDTPPPMRPTYPAGDFPDRVNGEIVAIQRVQTAAGEAHLRGLIEAHVERTGERADREACGVSSCPFRPGRPWLQAGGAASALLVLLPRLAQAHGAAPHHGLCTAT